MRCTSRPLQTTARTLLVRASALSSSSRLQQAQAMASGGGNAAIAEAADRGAASPQPGAKPKVIVVTGPTAVGKTKIGLEIAKRLGGEVISADSVQVYTGLDVGSDKLPEAQREGVRHHLIDVLPPAAEFSAGDFYDLARPAIADILGRGRVPVVVGGTGFYLRWLIRGKPATAPSSPEAQRRAVELVQAAWARAAAAAVEQEAQEAAVEQEATQEVAAAGGDAGTGGAAEAPEEAAAAGPSSQGEGGGAGQRQQDHDDQQQQHQQRVSKAEWRRVCAERRRAARGAAPPTAKELRDGNMPPDPPPGLSREALWAAAARVVADLGDPAAAARVAAERHNWYRLMRVCQILISNPGKTLAELDADAAAPPDFDFRCFFLHRPRAALYDRIAYRVEEMVAGGLLQEAKALLDAGVAPGGCPAARAIGYRQAMEFLEAARARAPAPPTREQLLGLVFAIGTATRKLVKSQHTWFRDDALFRWVDAAAAAPEAVADFILAEVAKPEHEGGCGDSGRLDKEGARELREYVQPVVLLQDDALVARVLGEVAAMVGADAPPAAAGDGGGGGGGRGGGGGGEARAAANGSGGGGATPAAGGGEGGQGAG